MERTVRQTKFVSPKRLRMKRTCAYARVSSGKDAMLHSLSAQVSYYSDLIQKHPEWEYCGVYADEAMTGTREGREQFQRMLADCRAGKIDIVITKSISRFARNTVTLLETIRELKSLGVAVFFEEQRINTLTADGELLITLLASFAQAESLSASENMKWRYRKGFENGELMGLRHLFGYDIDKDGIVINEEQANIVREIYDRFLSGESMDAIARTLNERQVTGALGGTVSGKAVRRCLEQEKYTGNALLQKSFVNNHLEKKQVRNRGEKPMYYAEGSHDAIIDKEAFDEAQSRLKEISDSVSGRSRWSRGIFSGKIRCAKCGANYIRYQNRKQVWICYRNKKEGPKGCPSRQVPDDTLREICSWVLGIDEFDEALFDASVDHITADTDAESNILTFYMKDGEVIVKRWSPPSRSRSWTKEMKEAARESGRKGGLRSGRKQECNGHTGDSEDAYRDAGEHGGQEESGRIREGINGQ